MSCGLKGLAFLSFRTSAPEVHGVEEKLARVAQTVNLTPALVAYSRFRARALFGATPQTPASCHSERLGRDLARTGV